MNFLKDLYNNFKNTKRLDSIKLCSFILFVKLSNNNNDKENILILLNKLNLDELNIYIDDIISILNNNFNTTGLTIHDIYIHHINNDTYLDAIEYCDYFSNSKLLEWINKQYNFKDNLLVCNYKFTNVTFNSKYNVYYDEISSLVKMNELLENKVNNNHTIDILKNDITKNFDTIFAKLPTKVTNLIHAQCCKKIKDLKIRGTKAEPLYLQYFMKSLNNNGSAYIIVPDHLLYNESKQHIDTRKYLLDNFDIKQIIQLSPDFFYKKNQKYSLLYFTKSGKTTSFEYLKLNTDFKIEKHGILEYNMIINNNNILFINYYNNKTQLVNNINNNIITKKINELYTISSVPNGNNIIRISKYFKDDSSVLQYNKDLHGLEDDAYYLEPKDNHKYFNCYVLNNLKYTMNKLLKNNSNQYDIMAISLLTIPIVDTKTQYEIIDYYKFKSLLIDTNNEQINKFKEMQNNFISININMYSKDTIMIEDICNIHSHNNIIDRNAPHIGIVKNSSNVGQLYINSQEFNSNSYYLSLKDNKNTEYDIEYVYIWLKYNNSILFDIAHNNTQKILNKTNINKFIVKNIDYNLQKNIITYYTKYNTMISNLENTNKLLNNDDIVSSLFL